MTDKEIMDDVDISECNYYDNGLCMNGDTGLVNTCFINQCSDYKNCYYKQLQRKEQECEELKKWKNEVVRLWNRTCKCELLDEKNAICKETLKECIGIVSCRDRYKQALKKIEELVLIISQMEHSCATETIFDIINEVKND